MHKLSIGKRHEFHVWGLLLKEGLDIYPALVDTKGIDGIVGANGKYLELQIKSAKNWSNHRGISLKALNQNPNRIFLIHNYTENDYRYFTARQILKEQAWQECIQWKIPQLKLNQTMLDKYARHDWEGFISYLHRRTGLKRQSV